MVVLNFRTDERSERAIAELVSDGPTTSMQSAKRSSMLCGFDVDGATGSNVPMFIPATRWIAAPIVESSGRHSTTIRWCVPHTWFAVCAGRMTLSVVSARP